MKTPLILGISAALLIGISAYVASDAWFIGLGVGVIGLAIMVLYVCPAFIKFGEKCRKRHECYLFIHSYLVTLSVCVSLEKAFEAAVGGLGKEFHRLDETLASMEAKAKVEYLSAYFDSDLYRLFLSLLDLYLNRGGDVLKLSSELTAEASRVEECEQAYQKKAARKGVAFFFLWLVSLVIVVFLRFGLSSFFSTLRTSWTYLGSLLAFYLFFLVSIGLYAYMHTGVKISFPRRVKREKAKG